MTTLGIGSVEAPKGVAEASFRVGWVKHFRVALSSAGGAAVVLALFELLQRQPLEAFRLLGVWGPWPIVALVSLAFLGRFLSRMNETVQTTFSAVVNSVQQGASAQGKTADALTRLAEQGGRQSEEVRRLAIYAGRELGSISERLDKQDVVMSDVARSIERIHTRLDERDKRG
jgi:hypothetical protein